MKYEKDVSASRLFEPPCLLGGKVGLYTLCIFACAKLNVIKKMCEMFQWKKDLRIPTTDINQECLLFLVKRYGRSSHYCRKKVAEKKWGFFRVNMLLSFEVLWKIFLKGHF